MSKTSKADKAKPAEEHGHEPAPEYGDVRPTMVNGQLLDPAGNEAPKQLSLGDRIRRAFTNELQIAVLLEILGAIERMVAVDDRDNDAATEATREGDGADPVVTAPTDGGTTEPKP